MFNQAIFPANEYLTSPPEVGDFIVYLNKILRYPGHNKEAKFVYLKDKIFNNCTWDFSFSSGYKKVRYATQDEIHLLKTCLVAGRYVEPENLSRVKVTKFILNEYYVRKSISGQVEWIFRTDHIEDVDARKSPRINVYAHSYSATGNFNMKFGDHYLATPDQRDHLDACIKAGKYVSWLQAQEEKLKQQFNNLNPNQNENKNNSNNTKNGTSSTICKTSRLISRVTTGQRPTGNVLRSRASLAAIEKRHLSYTTSVIKS
jgi:hypothetical protein